MEEAKSKSGGVFSLVSDEVVDAGTVAMEWYGFGFFFLHTR